MSVFVLGPCLEVVEPDPNAPPPAPPVVGRVEIAFGDPASEPGGIVNLVIVPNPDANATRPISVTVVFVTPVESVPAVADRTPEWFLGQPVKQTVTCDADAYHIPVLGVVPGAHFVQTVIEYPS